ncbi:MAG: sensor histidine kinase [Anaerolineales bacterium]
MPSVTKRRKMWVGVPHILPDSSFPVIQESGEINIHKIADIPGSQLHNFLYCPLDPPPFIIIRMPNTLVLKRLGSRPQTRLFLAISYGLWASVIIRWITEFLEARHPLTGLVSGMLLLYGILMGLEPLITGGSSWRAHGYLAFQTALVLVAILFHYQLDFFAILLLPLCGQATFLFPRRTAAVWVAILVAANVVGQIHQFGWPEGLSFIFLYSAGLIFVAAFSILSLQADEARRESERLLTELQEAHQQLQEYADQAQELAVAKERNRLARELHDSVAQTLYGLTLQSEAASRLLSSGRVDRVAEDLQQIRQSAQETLQETRLLIFELRPPILDQVGLAVALKARLEAVEGRSKLKTRIYLEEVSRLPSSVEVNLYRIAQEALNNVLKHARASQVSVSLSMKGGKVFLEIADDGVGFDPAALPSGVRMGLESMRERAAQIKGQVEVLSVPHGGTQVKVEVPV